MVSTTSLPQLVRDGVYLQFSMGNESAPSSEETGAAFPTDSEGSSLIHPSGNISLSWKPMVVWG
jgi:hypothetical protein